MIRTCLVCASPMPANEALAHLPHGERFAFDPQRGRLWVICRHCRRWNLAPIEARWEALEELDRVTHDSARLLAQTENIAMYDWGELELVRVGRAQRAEEAWWRYGRELLGRREQFKKIGFIGTAAVGAAILGGWTTGAIGWFGAWMLWRHGGDAASEKATDLARWVRFGSTAWRGNAQCPECGFELQRIRFAERERLALTLDDTAESIGIARSCPRCGAAPGVIRLASAGGERAARRILAYHHFAGASERRVQAAARHIEQAGSPLAFAKLAVGPGRPLSGLDRTTAIAMEITANEAAEQRMLQAELAELEAIWREEEQVAAIADGELTPIGLLESLRRRITGQNRLPEVA